jgi:alpha-D-xyloside xylohydrolase
MSAIFRLHCGRDDTRDPWKYQDPAEDVTRDYLQMRMRLLPVFYYAARENYETGMPILKRCDLNYPGYCQAKSDYQYLLGDDILVAPIMDTIVSTVNADWLNKGNGLRGEYFSGRSFSGTPEVIRTDPVIDFDWSDKPPAENISKDNFCVRWTGNISCKAGSDIKIGLEADDGCRLWIDDELVIDQWVDQAKTTVWAKKVYKDQKTYKIKIEYYEAAFQACCRLLYKKSGGQTFSERQLWIPPGSWIDVWNGKKVKGPANYKKLVSIKQMPIFVKEGSIIPLAPNMAHTGQKAWDPVTLDYYPGNSGISKAQIYEDDGLSNQYRNNRFRKTHFQAKIDDKRKKITLVINPSAGTFKKALKKRSWIVRMRSPQGWPERPSQVQVDGKIVSCKIVAKKSHAMPFAVSGAGPDCDIIEIAVPCDSILKKRNIVVSFGLL